MPVLTTYTPPARGLGGFIATLLSAAKRTLCVFFSIVGFRNSLRRPSRVILAEIPNSLNTIGRLGFRV